MMVKRFLREPAGNVSMMFGLMLIPMLIGAGVAIDMMRINNFRAQMSEAADSGLLAAARASVMDSSFTIAQAETLARNYFDANSDFGESVEIGTFEFAEGAESNSYVLTITGRIKTVLMGLVGQHWAPLNIVSAASIGAPRALEVVMVLDNTESMSGQKIIDLRDAATLLVDTIMADTDNEVLVGLAPFSTHVNIGVSRVNEPWLAAPANSSYAIDGCSVDTTAAANAGCTQETSTCYSDGNPYSCTVWQCPNDDPAPSTCVPGAQPTSWQGCAGSRVHPLNIQDAQFITDPVPGVLNDTGSGADCPGEILPMTTGKSTVISQIAAMEARGNTYIPGGLTWGLRLISPETPFTEGETYAAIQTQSGIKAIVLMTDGENTRSPNLSNGDHYSTDLALADQYTLEMCDEIKSNNIILYTIAFDITDSATLNMVRDCATNPNAFFNATDAVALSDAFGVIGNSLTELALTR